MAATTTALDLISDALKLIGALAAGETADAGVASDALNRLNDILEQWRLDRLMVYNVTRQTFPLVSSQQLYTIGASGADFTVERPVWIDSATIEFNHGTAQQFELPLRIFTDQEWGEVSMKAMASSFPSGVWFNQQFPLSQLYFWPIPNQAGLRVALMLPMEVLAPVTLASLMTMPPGYQKALRYALAVELAPEMGRELSALVLKIARESKASIMAQNESPVTMKCDAGMSSGRPWNWLDGGFGRRW